MWKFLSEMYLDFSKNTLHNEKIEYQIRQQNTFAGRETCFFVRGKCVFLYLLASIRRNEGSRDS